MTGTIARLQGNTLHLVINQDCMSTKSRSPTNVCIQWCLHDLDDDSVTLTLDLDLNILKMYLNQ